MKNYISYSEMRIWAECPYKHKLIHKDKISLFKGNEFTAFGKAVHDTCENALLNEFVEFDSEKYFIDSFYKEISKVKKTTDLNENLVLGMVSQGRNLSPLILPATKQYFKEYEVLGTEERLYEDIEEFEGFKFKGYIDLILKDKHGKIHIVDWKTCSWGWDAEKRNDKMIIYQLVLYKYFYAKKYGIKNLDNIDIHFALLKRTAKKDHVEFFKPTSGSKRTKNSLKILYNAIYNIKKNNHIKNKLSCGRCEFKHTEYCK